MKKNTEVGTERILCSSVGRVLLLATVLAAFCVVGCQNGKCQSCLFRNRDKEKIDETQLGQVKNQEPPAPPTNPSGAAYESNAGQEQRIAIAPTPVEPAPATSLAANDLPPQRIPNTASGSDLAALSSRQPTLGSIPDANDQARNFSNPQSSTPAPAPQFQSVSPLLPNPELGFASSDQDHSASLAPEAKNDSLPPAPNALLPPEMRGLPAQTPAPTPTPAPAETNAQPVPNAPLPAELTSQPPTAIAREPNPDPNAIQPPAESATPDPAAANGAPENADSAEYSSLMRDKYAIDSAYAMKKPVTLKGTARAQYVGNTSAVASAKNGSSATRAANRPATQPGYRPYSEARPATAAQPSSVASAAPAVVPGDSSAFVPNGQTSNIIPGMKLGVINFQR